MNADNRPAACPRPLIYRRAYELARQAIDREDGGLPDLDPGEVMRRLVGEVNLEIGDHAEARAAIEDGILDAVRGHEPRW